MGKTKTKNEDVASKAVTAAFRPIISLTRLTQYLGTEGAKLGATVGRLHLRDLVHMTAGRLLMEGFDFFALFDVSSCLFSAPSFSYLVCNFSSSSSSSSSTLFPTLFIIYLPLPPPPPPLLLFLFPPSL